MKLVSVIIPYFKKRKYITKAINSVLKQSYNKIEIIIIYDDEDKTDLDFINRLRKKDKRIKLLINDQNLGAGASRNKGIKFSKGNYIAFLDADDEWKKNKLKHQIQMMNKNKINVSHTSYDVINENNKKIEKREANLLSYKDLILSCDVGLSTVVINKNILNNNIKFANLKTKEDYILWLKISRKDIKFYPVKKYLTKWRKIENSLSSSILQKINDGYKVYFHYMKFNQLKSIYYLLMLSLNFLIKKKNSKIFK